MSSYETLLRLAFREPADQEKYLTPAVLGAHAGFEQAAPREQSFRFEQWRLGVATSLLRLLADLGDHDEARRAAEATQREAYGRQQRDIARIERDIRQTASAAKGIEKGTDNDHWRRIAKKVARTANGRADGDSVPKWSNPEIYDALPPPEELRPGKKIDFVQLIRKAKNEAAARGDATNAVTANDDFISFGDDDASTKDNGTQSVDDDEPRTNRRPDNGGYREGPMNDLDYVDTVVHPNKRPHYDAGLPERPQYDAGLPERPQQGRSKRKRGEAENVAGIVQEWLGTSRCDTAPWLNPQHSYAHLVNDPLKW